MEALIARYKKPLLHPKYIALALCFVVFLTVYEWNKMDNTFNNLSDEKERQRIAHVVKGHVTQQWYFNQDVTPSGGIITHQISDDKTYNLESKVENTLNTSHILQHYPLTKTDPEIFVNCLKLAKGNEAQQASEQDRVEKQLSKTTPIFMSSEKYYQLSRNCTEFIHSRGYHLKQSTEMELNFPLAFSIRFHHRIEMAERLLRAIYMPHNVYCIYIDKKSSQSIYRAMKSIVRCFPNVLIASKLDMFVYGSYSPVQADLQCMQDLLKTNVSWKYFLNTAGMEFPLKTNLEIVHVLQRLNGLNDIEQYPLKKMFYNRINQSYATSRDFNSIYSTHKPKPPFEGNITILKGCSYNSFSRHFVEWVLTDILANRFLEWSRDAHSPDEIVWGSLNALPQAPGGYPFIVTQINKSFISREVVWTSSALICHGRYQRGICILGYQELPWLSARIHFFANKFDIESDFIVYDCLEKMHLERTLTKTVDISWRHYERLPHFQLMN